MLRWILSEWLAVWTPALVPATHIHHAALRAGLRGEYPAAERLFASASQRYVEEYEADALARLRAQRRLFLLLAKRSAATR